MCHFLYIASPLTLSEVRSMLPPGLTADLASSPDQQLLKSIHPEAQTVARILAGRCSCDLIRPRLGRALEDERYLRERYRTLGVPRDSAITALERHREGVRRRPPAGGWPHALAQFIAEHARNAGPTLFHLSFSPGGALHPPLSAARGISVDQVRASPGSWLVEATPLLVSR